MQVDELFKNDWRYQGQDKYLYGKKLFFRDFTCAARDHDHCEFCWAKFGFEKENLKKGYCTEDNYHWICPKCVKDFCNYFRWKLF